MAVANSTRVGFHPYPKISDWVESDMICSELITAVKGLIVQTPGANVIKLFTAVSYEFL